MRTLKALTLGVIAAAAMASGAFAAATPTASKFDGRIRYVTYNGADVVRIDTLAGIATHIQLEEGETYVTHAFGDAAAWNFASTGNHVFLKPTADRADTNLILVTDRRTYNFSLVYHASKDAEVVYQLSFYYPDTAAKRNAERSEEKKLAASFLVPQADANTNYTMAGDRSVAPLNVWDDGKFTYFKFGVNRDIPAIYMVDADGNEAIVNRNSVGDASDVVVVQKVGAKWRLRLGQQALSVFNEQAVADADRPIATNRDRATGTSSPAVTRVVKGGAQ